MADNIKKNKFVFEVETWNVDVDERYYSFNYNIFVNGELKFENKEYGSDHAWGENQSSINGFKEELENGYAAQIALAEHLE